MAKIIASHDNDLSEFLKPCDVSLVETSGFVDLETRFKRLEQSGYVANFFSSMFDTDDERAIFLSDETEIFASDDEDTVQRKLLLQAKKREEILRTKLGDLVEADDGAEASQGDGGSGDKPPSQEPDTNK